MEAGRSFINAKEVELCWLKALSSLLTFFWMLFPLCLSALVKYLRDFLWGGIDNDFNFQFVKHALSVKCYGVMQWKEMFFGEGWWKKSTVVHGSLNWSNSHWNLSFIRVLQDWKIQSSVCFRDILYTTKVGS